MDGNRLTCRCGIGYYCFNCTSWFRFGRGEHNQSSGPRDEPGADGIRGGDFHCGPRLHAAADICVCPSSPATGGPITGDWNVTYGAPATVTITLAGGMYTESAKTPVLVFPGTSCYIQPGIAIATFTQTGPRTYTGHARLWSENTCTTGATTSVTLALSSDRNTLVASLKQSNPGMASTVILTRF